MLSCRVGVAISVPLSPDSNKALYIAEWRVRGVHCTLYTVHCTLYTVLGSMNDRGRGLASMPPPTLPMWHSDFLCINHISHAAACD